MAMSPSYVSLDRDTYPFSSEYDSLSPFVCPLTYRRETKTPTVRSLRASNSPFRLFRFPFPCGSINLSLSAFPKTIRTTKQ